MASSYGTDADKGSLRSNYLAARRAIPVRTRLESDSSIEAALAAFPLFAEAPLVLAYVSRGAEVGTRALIARLLTAGRRVAVPRTDLAAHGLSFHEIRSLDELAPGAMGILEPAAERRALTGLRRSWGRCAWFPAWSLTGRGIAWAMAGVLRPLPRVLSRP